MTFRVEVVWLNDGSEQRCSVVEMERSELALETLGMSLEEGKAMLHGVQNFMAAQQVTEDLKRKRGIFSIIRGTRQADGKRALETQPELCNIFD